MESRLDRLHAEQVMDHYQGAIVYDPLVVATATFTMSVNDFVTRFDLSAGVLTAVLPSVVEACGKLYTLKVVNDAAAGAAPNDLTITTKGTAPNKDAMRWGGDITLDRAGESVVLFSDGEEWHRMLVNDGQPIHHTNHIHEMFDLPFVAGSKAGDGVPSGTAGNENLILCGSGNVLEWHVLGTQTILNFDWKEPGLDAGSLDATADDGAEISTGIGTGAPVQFTVGTDPAFYFKMRFSIEDITGTDDCAMGFRKREAYQANVDDYDEMAVLNVISGAIYVETITKPGAATVPTDTTDTWSDTATHTLCVKVSSAGVVTYEIDDVAPTATAAFTFTTGTVLIPFFYLLNHTDLHGYAVIYEWECGYQA